MTLEKSRYTGLNTEVRSSYVSPNDNIRKSTNFQYNSPQKHETHNQRRPDNTKGLHNISDVYNFDDDVVINDVEMGKSLHESVYADDNQSKGDNIRNSRYGN